MISAARGRSYPTGCSYPGPTLAPASRRTLPVLMRVAAPTLAMKTRGKTDANARSTTPAAQDVTSALSGVRPHFVHGGSGRHGA